MSSSLGDGLGLKVVVLGGSGFVGSRVCKALAESGASVTSLSKSGNVPAYGKDEDWAKEVSWISLDLLSATDDTIDAAMGEPDAVVCAVGAIGTDPSVLLKGNGEANVAGFESAKRAGVKRISYVSVSDEVADCQENWLPEFFESYFQGKQMAEAAALDAVEGDSTRLCVVRPTFIYGGDSFGLLPPRVTFEYGSGIEELLSLGIFKSLADITPGLIKVALRPPVSVDSVAAACASAALGSEGAIGKTLDGAASINAATDQPTATGLTEAIAWTKEKIGELYGWAKSEVPKALEKAQETIEKTQSK